MAQKLPTPPKPYTPKELSTEVLVPMIGGNEGKTYIKFLIRSSVYTRSPHSERISIKYLQLTLKISIVQLL